MKKLNDREFINMLKDSYFPLTNYPRLATLNNAMNNRLNDIADKLDKYNGYKNLEEKQIGCSLDIAAKALYIIITKELDMEDFRMCVEKNENDYEAFTDFNSKQWTSSEISLEEYFLIKNVYNGIMDKFYGLKDAR